MTNHGRELRRAVGAACAAGALALAVFGGCGSGGGQRVEAAYSDPVARSALRERVIGMLTDASRSEDPLIRANAVEALQAAPGRVEHVAAAALKDPNLGVRYVGAMTVGELQLGNIAESVRPLLHDPSTMVRAAAIYALRRNNIPVDPTPLATMLYSSDPRERATAAFILGKLGDESAAPMLRDVVNEPTPLGARAEDKIFRMQVGEALVRLGRTDAIHAVRAALYPAEQYDVEAAVLAAQIIGEVQDRNSVGVLVARINERVSGGRDYLMPPELRLAAAMALGRMGYRDGAYVADEHAASADPALRAQAAFVYGETVRIETLPRLAAMLNDAEEIVRVSAGAATLRALNRLGEGGR